jgi:hypothetical protein
VVLLLTARIELNILKCCGKEINDIALCVFEGEGCNGSIYPFIRTPKLTSAKPMT